MVAPALCGRNGGGGRRLLGKGRQFEVAQTKAGALARVRALARNFTVMFFLTAKLNNFVTKSLGAGNESAVGQSKVVSGPCI